MKLLSLPRPIIIILFISAFSLFLFIANLVVYEAIAGIFGITKDGNLLILGSVLFVLSGSFILASIVGMRYYNWFTRWFYRFSAIWIGLFTYLFFAAFLYGLVLMVPFLPASSIGKLLVAGALLVSTYGILHNRRIRVSKIEVALPNLPEVWKGRKAIWISDVHLGQLYGSSHVQKIVDTVNALPHDIIFIGGDLYDGTGASDIRELVAPLKGFTGKLGTYFITGNHEEIGDSSAFVSAVRSANIRPLLDEMVEIDGLQIIGVDYRNTANWEDLQNILERLSLQKDKPSILLKHEPKNIAIAHDAGISFQISGHTHQAQMWPLGYIANFVYKGFGYGLHKHESMFVYTSSGVGTWGPPMRVGTDSEIVHITFI